MVARSVIAAANARLPEVLANGLTAVFIGATSGIGQNTLEQFTAATSGKSPRIYVVGRSATAASSLLENLKQSNDSAKINFIEQDVSLIRNVDAAVDSIKRQEDKVDLLFISPGFIPFSGRKDTIEGLEPSMTLRYYSRIRAVQKLLPLLEKSKNAHVVNVLAGGQESALIEDDLDLRNPKNFGFIKASEHSATMLTLVLERFASQYPRISFVHAFPGPTATPILTRGWSGPAGFVLRWTLIPLVNTLVSSSVAEVGGRTLFYATNARYTVPEMAGAVGPLPQGLSRSTQTSRGLFLVDPKSEPAGDEKLLSDLRDRLSDKVWAHTEAIFDEAINSPSKE